MPRKPTGNPTGRPKGQGPLGQDIQRLTIRLPANLYQRLEAFAEARTFNRGTPDLAKCARQLLAHALDSLHKRQSITVPQPSVSTIRQPESDPAPEGDTLQQTEAVQDLRPCGHPAERWNAKRRVCLDCDKVNAKAKRDQAKRKTLAHVENGKDA